MQRAQKIVEELKRRKISPTQNEVLNILREYIQTILLQLIYQSKFGGALSFMGGTCLRICHNIKRYSEDLDFCLDHSKNPYDFMALIEGLKKEMTLRGFQVSSKAKEEKVVQKGFLRFGGLTKHFGLEQRDPEQKLHIKLEVDLHPPLLEKKDRESFFVTRFDEIFPILKHNLPTLFAGKILALLYRPYQRGRDYYDLIWYLTRQVRPNLKYLNRGTKGEVFKQEEELFLKLGQKIKTMKPAFILKDMAPFLEDPSEVNWITRYQEVYEQLTQSGK